VSERGDKEEKEKYSKRMIAQSRSANKLRFKSLRKLSFMRLRQFFLLVIIFLSAHSSTNENESCHVPNQEHCCCLKRIFARHVLKISNKNIFGEKTQFKIVFFSFVSSRVTFLKLHPSPIIFKKMCVPLTCYVLSKGKRVGQYAF
jgi:hypothetical protein